MTAPEEPVVPIAPTVVIPLVLEDADEVTE
jgi:hypothetical protein